jgi:AbrB family looped-hinge helix DNA binding protein
MKGRDMKRAPVTTRVSTKGQVILPAELRKKRGWEAGQVLEVQETAEGLLLKAAPLFPATELEQVAGMLGPPPDGRPRSLADMDQAITEEVMARRARGRY